MLQLLINGVALGAAYALVALGFVLILNATGAVNFAQGDLVVAGGFTAVALAGFLPVPGIVLLPLVLVLTFIGKDEELLRLGERRQGEENDQGET